MIWTKVVSRNFDQNHDFKVLKAKPNVEKSNQKEKKGEEAMPDMLRPFWLARKQNKRIWKWRK